MNNEDVFAPLVKNTFDWLTTDFGAKITNESELQKPTWFESVRYDFDLVYLRIYKEKGQIGLLFHVKIDTDIIRSYMTHYVDLWNLMQWVEPDAADLQELLHPRTDQAALLIVKVWLGTHCKPILSGDLTLLESYLRKKVE